MHLVRTGAVQGIERLVLALGGDPFAAMRRVGLGQPQFRDPDSYIAYPKLAELLAACAAECRCPVFGLLLTTNQPVEVLGPLPMISARADTVGEALEMAERYLYLHASGVQLRRELRGDVLELGLELDIGNPPGLDQLLQLSVAHLAIYLAGLLDRGPGEFSLSFRQDAPPAGEFSRLLKYRRLRFEQEFDGLTLPAALLRRRVTLNEDLLSQHLQAYLAQLQASYPDSLEQQVRDVIGRLLPSGECNLRRVAATLDMGQRSLQSRLRERGTGYRELLEQTRCDFARQHLQLGRISITDLALQLGYAELAVFSRHFKRWTGQTPRQWRRSHRTAGSGPDPA